MKPVDESEPRSDVEGPRRWLVTLVGEWSDQLDLADHSSIGGSVEVLSDPDDGHTAVVWAAELDALSDPSKVMERARKIISHMSGYAALRDPLHRPVKAGSLVELLTDGQRSACVFPEPVRVTAGVGRPRVAVTLETGIPLAPDRTGEAVLAAAKPDAPHAESVDELLTLLDDPDQTNPMVLWKMFEVIRNGKSSQWPEWFDKALEPRLRRSINDNGRHSAAEFRRRGEGPVEYFSMSEVRATLLRLAEWWLKTVV